jgi:hypothetical protein
MKLRVEGDDGKFHETVICIVCGSPILLQEGINPCSDIFCEAEYDLHGVRVNLETQQAIEDKKYIESGVDNFLGLSTEEIIKLLGEIE